MPPYSELQEEPVTPTYELENSDAKDLSNDDISPSVLIPNDLPEPPFTESATCTRKPGDRQPRKQRRRVKSMPLNSEGAQDFFASAGTSNHRYERKGSAPQAFASDTPNKLLLLQENESIEEEEVAEENIIEEPTKVTRVEVREDVKAVTVKADIDSTSPSRPIPSQEPVPMNQADTACSCVIL